MEEHKRKVLDTFFRHGRLEKLPTQHKKRLIVLEQFARRFEPGRRYSEQEVTGIIMPLFEDYCTIRRLLVDEGLIRRNGMTYWRERNEENRKAEALISAKAENASKGMEKNRRMEIKRDYKQNSPVMGVYQIRNQANGRIYIGSSTNVEGMRNSRLFQLRMGKIVFNRDLQKDLTEFGAGNFEFSILEVLGEPLPGNRYRAIPGQTGVALAGKTKTVRKAWL